ncbi:FAD binding protein [Nitzschia inconspicua]|uniref:FAD binding protein n=1 Tax=Nitzschia inconspicua TaxID=303405 RepID=A0A9K3Q804_9STRA|nr:FAD binding protein [Nitzschia inconspicua]
MKVTTFCFRRCRRDYVPQYGSLESSQGNVGRSQSEDSENNVSGIVFVDSNNPTVKVSVAQVPYWLAITTIGFHLLPQYSQLMYLTRESHLLGNTCTTTSEWTWIFFASFLCILFPRASLKQGNRARNPQRFPCKYSFPITILRMNILWYAAACIGPFFWYDDVNRFQLNFLELLNFLGAKAAWPALWNFSLFILFPIHRNASSSHTNSILDMYLRMPNRTSIENVSGNLIKTKTDLRVVHIQSAIAAAFWLTVHAVFIFIVYCCRANSFLDLLQKMIPMVLFVNGKYALFYTEGIVNFEGWVACLMLLGLWITASKSCGIRQKYFEAFEYLHILFAVGFLLFSNLHDYNTLLFAWPGLAGLMADRLWSMNLGNTSYRYCIPTAANNDYMTRSSPPSGTEKVLVGMYQGTRNLLRLTVNFPMTSNINSDLRGLEGHQNCNLSCPRAYAGMHFLVNDKSISSHQWHPISVASVDREQQTITLYVKDIGDWSNAFIEKWHQESNEERGNREVLLNLRGPFGPNLALC